VARGMKMVSSFQKVVNKNQKLKAIKEQESKQLVKMQ